ncbi:MAG: hypothetical protein WCJ19_04425 [bacterium]
MDFLNFFRLDILQIVDAIKPFVLPIIWLVIPPFAFLRNTPIIGLISVRLPIFALACIFSSSLWELSLVIISFIIFGFIADIVAYTKMYKFWLWFVHKIPEESKTEKILKYYKKYPISVTIIGTYTAYTSCLMTPFARKYDLHWKKFWIPRYGTLSLVFLIWGCIWYYARSFNDFITNIGLLVVAGVVIALVINTIYSLQFLLSIKFFGRIKRYFKKND